MKGRWAWREQLAVVGPAAVAAVIAFVVAFQWVKPAPPSRVVIASGRADGAYYRFAEQYRALLAREGITLEVRETSGSLENIRLLEDPASGVDIGFVQGGTAAGTTTDSLASLGSLYFEPLWVFSRAAPGPTDLHELRGRRLAVGPEGSGTRSLALVLLAANGITAETARFLPLTGMEAVQALRGGTVDTAFLVAGPGSPTVEAMLGTPGVALLGFPRADAYTKRFPFLSKLVLPAGGISLEANLPPRETVLLAPAATLVVRRDFHPALVDLVLVTAAAVHGQRGMFETAKQFPSPDLLDVPLMGEAERYHKSGPPFLARYLPFWAATLADRVKVLILPLLVLVPLMRVVPPAYRWRVRSKIIKRYRDVVEVDQALTDRPSPAECAELLARLERIEDEVRALRVPLGYADAHYHLRLHLDLVRRRVQERRQAGSAG
ncbi:MAG TPA: TAXI family TRAP transporter solute-binding subunit [Methylomirabilota bacterium]